MEPIEVTARFDAQGTITPLELTWKGSYLRVESSGRRWTDEDGLHILVILASGRMVELIYRSGEGRWYLQRTRSNRAYA